MLLDFCKINLKRYRSSYFSKLSIDEKVNDLFAKLNNLKFLRISGIKMEHLTCDLVRNLSRLTILILNDCQLNMVDENVFISLPNLIHLSLFHNLLKKVPNLAYLRNLRYLDLSYNCIKLGEFQFDQLSELRTLRLKRNNIVSIQKSTFQGLIQLTEIDLESNLIESIGDAFSELIRLKFINLRRNKLTVIEKDEISMLVNLEELNVSENNELNKTFICWRIDSMLARVLPRVHLISNKPLKTASNGRSFRRGRRVLVVMRLDVERFVGYVFRVRPDNENKMVRVRYNTVRDLYTISNGSNDEFFCSIGILRCFVRETFRVVLNLICYYSLWNRICPLDL